MDEKLEPMVVSMSAARNMLAIGKTKLYELCAEKALDRRHIGRKAVVTVSSIRAYIEQLEC